MPSIYLSTQPKIKGFSENNGFLEYTIDIRDAGWSEALEEKTSLLKNDEDYLKQWYEIRDSNMVKYQMQMDDFCKKVWELL